MKFLVKIDKVVIMTIRVKTVTPREFTGVTK